jgi:hypothetical protein
MSRTSLEPDGQRWGCHVCGQAIIVEPSFFGDATCPKCGTLLWPNYPPNRRAATARQQLHLLGAKLQFSPECAAWRVNLAGCQATDETLRWLPYIEPLVELDLSHTPITNHGIATIAAIDTLEVLELGHTPINTLALARIAQLTRLEVLGLNGTAIHESRLTPSPGKPLVP